MMKKVLFLFLVFLASKTNVLSSDSTNILLLNPKIQFECTDAINDMYNFKFDLAERKFTWMMQEYPNHPLPHFLMGLSNWWKIMPNDESEEFDPEFHKYLDKSIELAEKLKEKQPKNPEANFFLASAYGLKARRHSDKGNYVAAAFATKKCLNFIESEVSSDLSSEFLLGTALYNYFREWIPDNKPILKPIVVMFPRGNKKLGMDLLEKVSNEAFYTRIEAMHFRIMIYEYENEEQKAIPIARYLTKTYPDNPYFERKLMRLNYLTGSNYKETIDIARDILSKFEEKKQGYEAISARYANFYIASLQINYQLETNIINDKVENYNKITKRVNTKNDKKKGNISKTNDSLDFINRTITTKNQSVIKKNHVLSQKKLSSFSIKYNKKIQNLNSKIEKYNKEVSNYNEKINSSKKAKRGYLRMLSYDEDVAPSIQYDEELVTNLENTVSLGKKLGYEKKNYHKKALYLLGRIYWKKGDHEKAKEYYLDLVGTSKKKENYSDAAQFYLKKYN